MITIQVNIVLLIALAVSGITIGYKLRRSRLSSLRNRVAELEQELHANYTDLLELKK